MNTLRAPFPYFGGKSRAAPLIWDRFGNVPNYVEPFAGSLAVLLHRPHDPKIETVNDKDCYLANFWRAVQQDPEAVAHHADYPVNEADLHARHYWLVNSAAGRVERLKTDPDYFDPKIAGWWVWGLCQWIGSGWCARPEWHGRTNAGRASRGVLSRQVPYLAGQGQGIHIPHRKLPHVGGSGRGDVRLDQKALPNTPSRQLPHLGGDVRLDHRHPRKMPILSSGLGSLLERSKRVELYTYFEALALRLRYVRVCCGDWSRVMGPSVTEKNGLTGILLDPPYAAEAERDANIYKEDDLQVAHEVREWAIANGDNPLLRIALCGYEGEHNLPASWECVPWKATGGYANQRDAQNENCRKERIWFSPHCLRPDRADQLSLDLHL